jgi:hypothetical protein
VSYYTAWLRRQRGELRRSNAALRGWNTRLRKENALLRATIDALTDQVDAAWEALGRLDAECRAEVARRDAAHREEVERLTK